MLIKVEEKKSTAALQPKGKLIVHLHWPDQANSDLDLWVRTDNPRNIVSFRQMDATNMWLDHDSQGAQSNLVKMADGTMKASFGNDEVVQFKECTNTRVTINVHVYRAEHGDFPMTPAPTVELIKADSFVKITSAAITLTGEKGQEVTAFSFDLAEDCSVKNIDATTYVPFVYNNLGSAAPSSAVMPTGPGGY